MGASESTLVTSAEETHGVHDKVVQPPVPTRRKGSMMSSVENDNSNNNSNRLYNDYLVTGGQLSHRHHQASPSSPPSSLSPRNINNNTNNTHIPILKGLVCGDSNVGKTCLLRRLRGDEFDAETGTKTNNYDAKNNNKNNRKLMALIPWSPCDDPNIDCNVENKGKRSSSMCMDSSSTVNPYIQNTMKKVQLHIIEHHHELQSTTSSTTTSTNRRSRNQYNIQNINFIILIIDRSNRKSLEYAKNFVNEFFYDVNRINKSEDGRNEQNRKDDGGEGVIMMSFPSICILLNHYDLFYDQKHKKEKHPSSSSDNNDNTKVKGETSNDKVKRKNGLNEVNDELIPIEEIQNMINEIKSKHDGYIQSQFHNTSSMTKSSNTLLSLLLSSSSTKKLQIQSYDACMKNGYGIQALNSFLVLPYLQYQEKLLMDGLIHVRRTMELMIDNNDGNDDNKDGVLDNSGNFKNGDGDKRIVKEVINNNNTTKKKIYQYFTYEELEQQRRIEIKQKEEEHQQIEQQRKSQGKRSSKQPNQVSQSSNDNDATATTTGNRRKVMHLPSKRDSTRSNHDEAMEVSNTEYAEKVTSSSMFQTAKSKSEPKASTTSRRQTRGSNIGTIQTKEGVKSTSISSKQDYWKVKYTKQKKQRNTQINKKFDDPKKALEAFLASDDESSCNDDGDNDKIKRSSKAKNIYNPNHQQNNNNNNNKKKKQQQQQQQQQQQKFMPRSKNENVLDSDSDESSDDDNVMIENETSDDEYNDVEPDRLPMKKVGSNIEQTKGNIDTTGVGSSKIETKTDDENQIIESIKEEGEITVTVDEKECRRNKPSSSIHTENECPSNDEKNYIYDGENHEKADNDESTCVNNELLVTDEQTESLGRSNNTVQDVDHTEIYDQNVSHKDDEDDNVDYGEVEPFAEKKVIKTHLSSSLRKDERQSSSAKVADFNEDDDQRQPSETNKNNFDHDVEPIVKDDNEESKSAIGDERKSRHKDQKDTLSQYEKESLQDEVKPDSAANEHDHSEDKVNNLDDIEEDSDGDDFIITAKTESPTEKTKIQRPSKSKNIQSQDTQQNTEGEVKANNQSSTLRSDILNALVEAQKEAERRLTQVIEPQKAKKKSRKKDSKKDKVKDGKSKKRKKQKASSST